MEKRTKVVYLREKSTTQFKGEPFGCLAFKVDDDNNLQFQYSVTNPQDTFKRKVGRSLAVGRLVEEPLVVQNLPRLDFLQSMEVIMKTLLAQKSTPTKVQKAARAWLKRSKEAEQKNSYQP